MFLPVKHGRRYNVFVLPCVSPNSWQMISWKLLEEFPANESEGSVLQWNETYTVSQKMPGTQFMPRNSRKCRPILIILSLSYSWINCRKRCYYIYQFTWNISLHYLETQYCVPVFFRHSVYGMDTALCRPVSRPAFSQILAQHWRTIVITVKMQKALCLMLFTLFHQQNDALDGSLCSATGMHVPTWLRRWCSKLFQGGNSTRVCTMFILVYISIPLCYEIYYSQSLTLV